MYRANVGGVSCWVQRFVRFGYLTKGIVYGLIGWLAAKTALGARGSAPDTEQAIREIGSQGEVGETMLLVVAAGLAIYSSWRFVQAVLDVDGDGKGASGVLRRLGYAVSGGSYALLAIYAMRIGIGLRGSGPDSGCSPRSRRDLSFWPRWRSAS
jgi:hypothetical protein